MYIPGNTMGYVFAVLGLVGWGSWANTLVAGGSDLRFEVFYVDYTLGILFYVLICNAIAGQISDDSNGVFSGLTWANHDFTEVSGASIGWAIFGGIVFNVANILLSKGITMAGMAIAFPIAIGACFILGTLWLYLQNQETTKAALLFTGVALGAIALILFSQMYNVKEKDEKAKKAAEEQGKITNIDARSDISVQKAAAQWNSNLGSGVNSMQSGDIYAEKKAAALGMEGYDMEKAPASEAEEKPKISTTYMISLLLIAGLLMSGWAPILGFGSIDSTDPTTLDKLSPYGQMFWFALAILFSDFLFIPLLLQFPVDRTPSVPFKVFLQGFKCSWKAHALCFLGGIVWGFGFMSYVLSSSSCSMNPATAYALGQCAPLAAILWGTLLWKEFKGVRKIVWIYLLGSVAFYIGAVVLASIARESSDDACNISITTAIPTIL